MIYKLKKRITNIDEISFYIREIKTNRPGFKPDYTLIIEDGYKIHRYTTGSMMYYVHIKDAMCVKICVYEKAI